LAEHAPNLGQLLEQVALRVKPPRGVDHDHVEPSAARLLDAVEHHRRGVGAGAPGKARHARALRPSDHLLDAGRPIRVGSDHQRLAALIAQQVGKLADGGGLPRSVDAVHEDAGGRRLEPQGARFL
jgi:hypothetical protein